VGGPYLVALKQAHTSGIPLEPMITDIDAWFAALDRLPACAAGGWTFFERMFAHSATSNFGHNQFASCLSVFTRVCACIIGYGSLAASCIGWLHR
jgi:hypothetical protein